MLQTRRRVLSTIAFAGAAALFGMSRRAVAEEPPETTAVRLANVGGVCVAPQYIADDLLREEGFTEIRYVETSAGVGTAQAMARGEVDFSLNYAPPLITAIDAGAPITMLAGVMVGCFELFGHEGIRTIADLKGRSVGVQAVGSSPHLFLVVMAAYVGLDPIKDIRWVASPDVKPIQLFAERKIDAFLGFAPEPQDLRARRIGAVIVNSAADRPWSQYFCCLLSANRTYARNYPAATKRVLRAILKAADLCVADPAQTARRIVDRGFTDRYDYTIEAVGELPYDKWREWDPDDTLRFYGVRLHEAGLIKSSPQKIMTEGTDWRFLNELKRELKA
jgi:NitT/TauT family transport system substrate-binding protein